MLKKEEKILRLIQTKSALLKKDHKAKTKFLVFQANNQRTNNKNIGL